MKITQKIVDDLKKIRAVYRDLYELFDPGCLFNYHIEYDEMFTEIIEKMEKELEK